MKRRLLDYIEFCSEEYAKEHTPEQWRALQDDLLKQIVFFQHERHIHLIVTALFALLTFGCAGLVLLTGRIIAIIMCGALILLLIPYIRHYYILENGTQTLYAFFDTAQYKLGRRPQYAEQPEPAAEKTAAATAVPEKPVKEEKSAQKTESRTDSAKQVVEQTAKKPAEKPAEKAAAAKPVKQKAEAKPETAGKAEVPAPASNPITFEDLQKRIEKSLALPPEPEAKPEPKPGASVKPEPVIEKKAEPKPKVEVKPEAVIERKAEPKPTVEVNPKVEMKPETVIEGKAEPNVKAETKIAPAETVDRADYIDPSEMLKGTEEKPKKGLFSSRFGKNKEKKQKEKKTKSEKKVKKEKKEKKEKKKDSGSSDTSKTDQPTGSFNPTEPHEQVFPVSFPSEGNYAIEAKPYIAEANRKTDEAKKSVQQPKQELKQEKKPEVKPEAKAEPKPEPKPVPKPEPKPEPKPVPKPEPKPEPKPVPKPEPKPEPKPVPAPVQKPAEKKKHSTAFTYEAMLKFIDTAIASSEMEKENNHTKD